MVLVPPKTKFSLLLHDPDLKTTYWCKTKLKSASLVVSRKAPIWTSPRRASHPAQCSRRRPQTCRPLRAQSLSKGVSLLALEQQQEKDPAAMQGGRRQQPPPSLPPQGAVFHHAPPNNWSSGHVQNRGRGGHASALNGSRRPFGRPLNAAQMYTYHATQVTLSYYYVSPTTTPYFVY